MTSRSNEYWRKRTLQLEELMNKRGVEYYHELEKAYRQAAKTTHQEIMVLYNRLAANNGLSLSEARKLLTTNELKEFRWTVEEYIERGRASNVNETWMQQLENASLRYRISRLEAMKVQMQNQVEVLMGNELDGVTKLMKDIYTEGYYRTGHLLQTGWGVASSFAEIDPRRVEAVIAKPWLADGKNFSQRIWGNHRPALINDLHTGLAQAFIRGDSPDKLINYIEKKYKVAGRKAGTLVMTERAYFSQKAQQDCYDELDVEEQQFTATLDLKTSDICRDMDGRIFKSSEIQIGVNAPPMHCNCRSVMSPYMGERYTRMARDVETGKSVRVPGNLTYHEWYDQYVKGTSAEPVKKASKQKLTLKEKVEGIKSDVDVKRSTLKGQQVELQSAKTELKITQEDIQVIDNRLTTLKSTQTKYNTWNELDFKTGLAGMEDEINEYAQKVKTLDAQHSRYYDRPERGTAAYDEWRSWRKGVDYEELFNSLVAAKTDLATAESQLKRMQEMKAFVDSVDIDDLKQQIAKLDDALTAKKASAISLTDDIAKLTDDIADTRIGIESDYKRAGKAFIEELDDVNLIGGDELAALREKNSKAYKAYCKETDRAKRAKLFDEYAEANKAYFDMMRRMAVENPAAVKGVLSNVRSLGASNADDLVKVHLGNSRSKVVNAVKKAYEHYPTEWVDASAAFGKVSLKKANRGYYSHGLATFAISGNDEASQMQTAIHEIAHRFERVVDDMREMEKAFYERRTKGEDLQWLGAGYRSNEKARFDDFILPYMGKDYGGDAYEIISMGFEYGFTDPLTLMKDADMAEFIFGLLLMK